MVLVCIGGAATSAAVGLKPFSVVAPASFELDHRGPDSEQPAREEGVMSARSASDGARDPASGES